MTDDSQLIWYYSQDEKIFGPFAKSEMQTFLNEGKINPLTTVWKKDEVIQEIRLTGEFSVPSGTKPFTGDSLYYTEFEHRPFSRFLAKQIDWFILSSVLSYIYRILGISYTPTFMTIAFFTTLLMIFLEPLSLFHFKTTPGKYIMNVKVVHKKYGENPPYSLFLYRSLLSIMIGCAFFISELSTVTMIISAYIFWTGKTLYWDKKYEFKVITYQVPLYKYLFSILIFIILLCFIVFFLCGSFISTNIYDYISSFSMFVLNLHENYLFSIMT